MTKHEQPDYKALHRDLYTMLADTFGQRVRVESERRAGGSKVTVEFFHGPHKMTRDLDMRAFLDAEDPMTAMKAELGRWEPDVRRFIGE